MPKTPFPPGPLRTDRPDDDPPKKPSAPSTPPLKSGIPTTESLLAKGKETYNVVKHPSSPQITDKVGWFTNWVKQAAREAANALEVPVEAVVAQWALESGWGQSELARKHHNLGGIKAYGGWKGDIVRMPTFEKDKTQKVVEPFRSYRDLEAYARDYTKVVGSYRYRNARATGNVRKFAMELGKAGYHQDSPEGYADTLVSIAQRVKPFLA